MEVTLYVAVPQKGGTVKILEREVEGLTLQAIREVRRALLDTGFETTLRSLRAAEWKKKEAQG